MIGRCALFQRRAVTVLHADAIIVLFVDVDALTCFAESAFSSVHQHMNGKVQRFRAFVSFSQSVRSVVTVTSLH